MPSNETRRTATTLSELAWDNVLAWRMARLDVVADLCGRHAQVMSSAQYVVAAPRDQPEILPADLHQRLYRPQAWFSPTMVRDSRMIGAWRHERNGTRVMVAVEPFQRLSSSQKVQVADEANRLAHFLDGNVSLTFVAPP